MPLEISAIDLERALFRMMTKSARKGEPTSPSAAAEQLAALSGLSGLPERDADISLDAVADEMQRRVWGSYPLAPDLRVLLDQTTPLPEETLRELQTFDWVTVGIYVFGLPPTKTRSGSDESAAHRALKEWAASNGQWLDAPRDSIAITERWFPSGDEADAAFIGDTETLIVEVRPAGAEPHELQQALFALVKMRAVREAELLLDGRYDDVRVSLLLEAQPPDGILALAETLRVSIALKQGVGDR